jgi:hypothetical protein
MFRHLHCGFKIVGVGVDEQISLAAMRTFVGNDAGDEARLRCSFFTHNFNFYYRPKGTAAMWRIK